MSNLKRSLAEMKAICNQHGSYYFEPDTVRFWGATVHDPANRWGLFVESYDSFNREYKLYAVKFFAPNGLVTVIEPADIGRTYEHFKTLDDAIIFRYKLSAALDKASNYYRENRVLSSLTKIHEEGLHTGIYVLSNDDDDSIKINTNNFSRFICG